MTLAGNKKRSYFRSGLYGKCHLTHRFYFLDLLARLNWVNWQKLGMEDIYDFQGDFDAL